MDRRSWPWKKKSSDKAYVEKAYTVLDSSGASLTASGPQSIQDIKKPSYIQISLESYSRLSGLEDQVKAYMTDAKTYENQIKSLEDQIKSFEGKLSSANSEIISKEDLVKQHVKVAEEAVSGWEKAEAEALALKDHLEDVTLSKLTAEDRASHLDSALKECMKQIRAQKEEHEQKLNEVVFSKTNQWEKLKREFEVNISNLEDNLVRSAAESAALSRTLQERSSMVITLNEEKAQAEAAIEVLKSNIESYEKEISSLKYEVHVVSKEVEIRNEEKKMSMKSAEVSNKLHLEAVKKITKLEAECQRLKGLVRKKLPGPAALAQMKLEVENMGYGYVDSTARRYPVKPNDLLKKNEFLNERLLAMEEERNLLQEELVKRNSELDASRNIFAATASKLQILESQMQDRHGNEDSPSTKHGAPLGAMSTSHISLMDDFLEMEKLACLETESARAISCSNSATSETLHVNASIDESSSAENKVVADDEVPALPGVLDPNVSQLPIQNLQSRISMAFSNDNEIDKVLEEIKCLLQDTESTLHQESKIIFKEIHCPDTDARPGDADMASEKEVSFSDGARAMNDELASAISEVHKFIISLGKETNSPGLELQRKIEEFSAMTERVLSRNISLFFFVQEVACILSMSTGHALNSQGYKGHEVEFNSSDCIDKIALSGGSESDAESATESAAQGPSLEEYEKVMLERESLESSLAKCSEDLEAMKSKLIETEELLAAARCSNGLTETQLKCMVEAYKSLEAEVNSLRARTENLELELIDERRSHGDALNRCEELQEELGKYINPVDEIDPKSKQETELAAAAEKLAECQETIFLLSRQLNALRPSSATDVTDSPASTNIQRTGSESPTTPGKEDDADFHLRKSPMRPKHYVHRPTKSGSSSSSTPTPEKQSRGFTRFFSSNARNSR